ncbi:MAG: hypothetical protein ACYC7A_02950 [Thermoanaerobaculia bacterium]
MRMLVVTILVALAAASATASSPEIYYPPDVAGQIRSLARRADAMGFHIGSSPDPSMCYHYQAVARSNGPGTPYFFVSKSGNHPGGICVVLCNGLPCTEVGDGPGNLLVVKMGSRDTDGERLRSNRLVRDTETQDSEPPDEDTVVTVLTFDGTDADDWPAFGHIGGSQVIGDVLALALEKPYDPADIEAEYNAIQFVDVSNPEVPVKLKTFKFTMDSDTTAGVVAIAPIDGGKHLMFVTGKDGQNVYIFESNGESLKSPALDFVLKTIWHPSPTGICGWPSGDFYDYSHQQFNFVREGGPGGPLWLIGTRNTNAIPGPFGDDMIDAYRVSWDGTTFGLECVAQRHVVTAGSSDDSLVFETKTADFAAGGGIYVSPTGELIVYGTEHDNDGPGGTVKMAEFRTIDMVRAGEATYDPTVTIAGPYTVPEGGSVGVSATAAPPRTKPWVELFADPDYSERYVVIDWADWAKDDFKDLDDAVFNPIHDGFSDQASSARWFAPVGCTMRLNDDDFGDDDFPGSDTRTLQGTGAPVRFADLSDVDNNSGSDDIADSLTSMQWFSDCDAYYDPSILGVEWDLDSNGSYETAGGSFTFSAAELDGPSSVPLRARVVHPSDGRIGYADSSVTVTNVAPLIGTFGLRDGAGRELGAGDFVLLGLPVTFHVAFTDPGKPDTHVVSIDWGDGVVSGQADLDAFTAASGGNAGSASDAHAYASSGEFTVFATITDDDGGIGSATSVVLVMTAEEALDWLIDQLPPGKARDYLDGSNGGAAENGAIDHLRRGQTAAAMTMIVLAMRNIDDPDLQATLALIAQSIATEAYASALPAVQRRMEPHLAAGAAAMAAHDWQRAVEAFAQTVYRS